MTSIRIMTYNIRQGLGRDGRVAPERALAVIGDGAPDIVALQEVTPGGCPGQLALLAEQLGMRSYGDPVFGGTAFLSDYPLAGLQSFDLDGGWCLRADADIGGKRLHLFNLHLTGDGHHRHHQITKLLGPDLLGSSSLVCPCLILGDFGDFGWSPGNIDLALQLRKIRRPLWRGTFPACLPLADRDRAYVQGDLRVLSGTILRSPEARNASSHLPLILTVQLCDPRSYLRLEKLKARRMEIAPG